MSEINENILDSAVKRVGEITEEYQEYVRDKYNKHLAGTSPVFYSILDNSTRKYQRQVISECADSFLKLCKAAGVVASVALLRSFRSSISFYVKQAFSQYKNTVSLEFSKFREGISEASMRESFLKEALKARFDAMNFMLGKDDIIISAGRRSYHLSNYVRMLFESEAASKFVMQTVIDAKNDGAIGIKISDHGTVCKICEEFEGKTYLFANNGLSKLLRGLPPFHPNCRHFIIPVYEDN